MTLLLIIFYATAKLTTLKTAINKIAGEVLLNFPVKILISAYAIKLKAIP